MTKYYARVDAIQIGDDLHAACSAVNECSRRAGEARVSRNGNCVIISRADGSFTAAAVGDWIVVRRFDGAMFALTDEAFRSDYKPMSGAA